MNYYASIYQRLNIMRPQLFLSCFLVLLVTTCATEKNITLKPLLNDTDLHAYDERTQNCGLIAENWKVLEDSSFKSKLLYITIKFKNGTELPGSLTGSQIFKPLEWVRITGSQHNGILQLRPNYEILSLNSLAVQTERVDLELQDTPSGCLQSLTVTEYILIIRKFLFNKFKEEETEICNNNIENRNGYAEFYHTCCEKDDKNKITCNRTEKNDWMKTLDVIMYIIIILAILYCPYVIPTKFYKKKHSPSTFEYKPEVPLQLKVKRVTRSGQWWENNHEQEIVPFSKLSRMSNFLKTVKELETDSVYELCVSKIKLHIRNDEILTEDEAPTSLAKTLYEAFVECGIRDKSSETKATDCCNANILGGFKPCGRYPWYKCLRILMRILISLVACLPWVLRITVFYLYESDIRMERQDAADDRNLEVSFEENLTYFFTPVHAMFLVCYGILACDYILFGFVSTKIKSGLQMMIQSCLRGMCNRQRKVAFKWAFRVLTSPLRKFGIFGFIVGPIFWIIAIPFVIIVLSFRLFPTIHLALSLMWNFSSFFSKKSDCCIEHPSLICRILNYFEFNKGKGNGETKAINLKFRKLEIENRAVRFFVILTALLTTTSFVLLTVECIVFVIEVAVYTMIGLVLNSSHAMQYVSVASIGWLYYNSCFNGVTKLYAKYNAFIHNILLKENQKKVSEVARLTSDEQKNTAFRVKHSSSKLMETVENDFGPILLTNGVVLLLDKYDTPYISKTFFFDACSIQHPQCPGELSDHLITAFRRFISIIMFLLFVTVIVLAFGDAYSISISNQLLATVAGGFVPWLLMKSDLLFSKPADPNFDDLKDNLNFMSSFHEKITENEVLWSVSDFEVCNSPTRNLDLKAIKSEGQNGTTKEIMMKENDTENMKNEQQIETTKTITTYENNAENTKNAEHNGTTNGINSNGPDIEDVDDWDIADLIVEIPSKLAYEVVEMDDNFH